MPGGRRTGLQCSSREPWGSGRQLYALADYVSGALTASKWPRTGSALRGWARGRHAIIRHMGDGLELQRYLLNREIQFWVDEGRDETSNRIMGMAAGSPEETREKAWQEHCVKRLNEAAWELEELEGRGSQHQDADVVNIEDWRKSET